MAMNIVKDPKQVPAFAKITGKLEMAITWTDKNGQNVAAFGRRKGKAKDDDGNEFNSEYLTVEHVASLAGATRTLRTVNDHVDKCELDLILTVIDASVGLTDLDGDGIGELTFGYKLACVSDVSPIDMKLLMLENGDKYILRGTDRVPKMGSYPATGGSYKVDASFQGGPPAFLAHAKAVWERTKRR